MGDRPELLFTAAEAAEAVGGELAGDRGARVRSVVVDSRKAGPGALFAALPGERTDGHAFVGDAFRLGASCVLARADRRAELLASGDPPGAGAAIVFVNKNWENRIVEKKSR